MAQVFYGSSQDFNTLAFGLPNMNTARDLYNDIMTIDRSMYHDTSFIDRALANYELYNGSDALLRARTLLANTNVITNVNYIGHLNTLQGLQTANPMMQQYIMANPIIRQLYHESRCNGYNETYIDTDPSSIGHTHYDYQKVMDGIVHDENIGTEDNPEYVAKVNIYVDLKEEDRLSPSEQIHIVHTWETLTNYIDVFGEDPTSPYGDSL